MKQRLAVVGALVALLLVLAAGRPADAHAVLLSSSPPDGAHLDAAPGQVVLEFNEDVSASLGAVRVFDAAGTRVDQGTASVSGTTITTPLQPDLGDGAYIVSWRAVSADSHPIHGAFTFTVGDVAAADDATVAGLVGGGSDRTYEWAGHAGRALAYGGTLLAVGLTSFLLLAHDGGDEGPGLRRTLRVAAVVGIVGVVVAVPIRAALATGLGLTAITEPGVLGQVLADGIGWTTAVTIVGLVLLLLDVGRHRVDLVAAALAIGVFAWAGHTTTARPAWLAIGADLVHATAGAVWLGGLVGLAAVLRNRTGDRAAGAAPVVARFSGMATIALLAVAGAGTALAWDEVRAKRALTGTDYGKLLLVKVAIVAAVALVGGWNRFRLVPSMARAPKKAAARLRRTVAFEAAALLATVGVTAVLVNVTPAASAAGIGTIFSSTVPLDDGSSVNVVVDPNRVGQNSIHLYLFDDTGRTYNPQGLTVKLTLPSADIGPIERTPVEAGPGHWQLDGGDLSIAGTWTIELDVRTDRFSEETASVDVTVNP